MRSVYLLLLVLCVSLFGCQPESQDNAPVYSEDYPNVSVISKDSLANWMRAKNSRAPLLLESSRTPGAVPIGDIISVAADTEDLVFLENVAHDDPIVCFGEKDAEPGILCERLVEAGYQNVALLNASLSAQEVVALPATE